MNMKRLTEKVTKVFQQLHGMTKDNYLKLDNKSGLYMPVVFEILGQSAELQETKYDIVSMAHYYLQNGDLMADPEMTFLCGQVGDEYIVMPGSYRQDGLGINQESIRYTKDEGWRYNKVLQIEHTQFAEMWLKNIKEQQKIEVL